MSSKILEKKKSKSHSSSIKANDFEKYLQTRRENTTYNGIELESEGWQKEIFGVRQ